MTAAPWVVGGLLAAAAVGGFIVYRKRNPRVRPAGPETFRVSPGRAQSVSAVRADGTIAGPVVVGAVGAEHPFITACKSTLRTTRGEPFNDEGCTKFMRFGCPQDSPIFDACQQLRTTYGMRPLIMG